MKKELVILSLSLFLNGCASMLHCTNGGQWSSYYKSGDGRCAYFCADKEEKYCANTPLLAEKKLKDARLKTLASDPEYQRILIARKAQEKEIDKAACIELGFKEDSDSMAICMLTKSQNRREDEIAEESAFDMANQRQLQKQENDRSNARRAAERAMDANKQVTCTTVGSITTCR